MNAHFPMVLDNTMLKVWRTCPQRFYNEFCLGLTPKGAGVPVDLHFGTCLDKAIEAARRAFFERGESADSAMHMARNVAAQTWASEENITYPAYSNKSFGTLAVMLDYYFHTWPLGEEGLTPIEGGIQFHDTIELPVTHPVSYERLKFAVNLDLLARNAKGQVVVVDEKTTGKFSDSWMSQWDMDTQISGYLHYAQPFGDETFTPHALIRGLCPGTSKTPPSHMEVPIYRTKHQLDMWWQQTIADVLAMTMEFEDSRDGCWPKRLGTGCNTYGRPCEYVGLCNTPNAEAAMEANFEQVFWDPVTRTRSTKA